MKRIEVDLPVLEVMFLDETGWLKAALNLVADGVIRAHRLVRVYQSRNVLSGTAMPKRRVR
jgi:hypothetical protein